MNIRAAKTHLSRLVERAAAGEEIVIAKAGKQVARLVPLRETKRVRQPGSMVAQPFWISDDLDAPLP